MRQTNRVVSFATIGMAVGWGAIVLLTWRDIPTMGEMIVWSGGGFAIGLLIDVMAWVLRQLRVY